MNIGIVTGASSGLGMEFVKQLSKKYSGLNQIWVIARRVSRLEALAKRVKCDAGVTIVPIYMDLLDMGRIVELEEMLREENPRVRILVNCAGFGKLGAFTEQDMNDDIGMIRVNCEALTALTHMVLPYMPPKSRIIQIASAASFLPQPYFAVYAATKAYVSSFSRALDEELRKRKVTVMAVCPGPVKTEFFDVAADKEKIPAYKQIFYADPKDVVRKAISDCARGRKESVYGGSMKLVKLMTKLLPQQLLIRIVGWMQG